MAAAPSIRRQRVDICMTPRFRLAADMPPLTSIIVEAEDETGPFGAKGLGEAAIMGAAPAIANAIYNAVGIRLKDLPLTPEKVLKALAEQKSK
jgi:CO/xanthine dehydrogenase Mo-binding subunit